MVVGCSDDSEPLNQPFGTGGAATGGGGSGVGGVGATIGSGGVGVGANGSGGAGATASGGGGAAVGGNGSGGVSPGGGTGGTSEFGDYELPIVDWPSATCVTQVNTLLGQMSLQQKVAQMVMGQYGDVGSGDVSSEEVGTVFSSGSAVPGSGSAGEWASLIDGYITASQSTPNGLPILFGIDAVHGNSKATGTVIFPHNIGLGCTRNPELLEEVGKITASEMAATGANWTFGPVLSVSHDDRWGRTYESYSEDPGDVALFGGAVVVGLQGRGGLGTGAPGVIACAKHFAGDGQATYGTSRKPAYGGDPGGLVDRGDVQIEEATMRTLGIAPYIPAIEAGLGSIMVADTTWNGVNMTGHQQLLTTILKGELGFAGFVTTDWDAVMPDQNGPGVVTAINAGVDMLMAANGWQSQRDEIAGAAGGSISQERIDDAVRRVLTVKCEAGLFGRTRDASLMAQVGSAAHRAVGRQAVRESLVLLQHEGGVLPLTKGSNVWVAGSGADDLGRQTGGWTIGWQDGGDRTQGTTIRDGISAVANVVSNVAEADAAIVVLSEGPYAEWYGDVSSIDTLPSGDFSLLSEARNAGKPVVAIIVSGRPVLIADQLANADAWIAAWLPGTEGDGVAEVLFGDYNFTGKLGHSWPRTNDQANMNKDDAGFAPLFPYGHGLTY
jgi:beta-glucosidase